jgi:hypothetical protein
MDHSGELIKFQCRPTTRPTPDAVSYATCRPQPRRVSGVAELLKAGGASICAADLDRVRVRFVDSDGKERQRWIARDCFFTEVSGTKHTYVLSGGRWYEVAAGLVEEVNAAFAGMSYLKESLVNFQDDSEEEYCKRFSASNSEWLLLDRKPISYGGGRSQVEFCDFVPCGQANPASREAVRRIGAAEPLISTGARFGRSLPDRARFQAEGKREGLWHFAELAAGSRELCDCVGNSAARKT